LRKLVQEQEEKCSRSSGLQVLLQQQVVTKQQQIEELQKKVDDKDARRQESWNFIKTESKKIIQQKLQYLVAFYKNQKEKENAQKQIEEAKALLKNTGTSEAWKKLFVAETNASVSQYMREKQGGVDFVKNGKLAIKRVKSLLEQLQTTHQRWELLQIKNNLIATALTSEVDKYFAAIFDMTFM